MRYPNRVMLGQDISLADEYQYAQDLGLPPSAVEYTPTLGPPTGGGFITPTGPTVAQTYGNVFNLPSPNITQTAPPPLAAAVGTGVTGTGPSPVVQIPLSTASMGMWLENATLISGIPNWEVLAGGALLLVLASSFMGGGRRRRR